MAEPGDVIYLVVENYPDGQSTHYARKEDADAEAELERRVKWAMTMTSEARARILYVLVEETLL